LNKALLLIFTIFFSGANVSAQEIIGPIREMFQVDSIEITGNRKVESEAITEKLNTRPDMILDNYLLRKDLSRIYDMKYFEEVEAWHKKRWRQEYLAF
jgi:outer membrane protein insertion porin family